MKFGWSRGRAREQDVKEKIDYSYLSDEELLDMFKTENWERLGTEEQRIGIIQEYENRCAYVQGREAAEIVSLNKSGCYGSFNSMDNQISIDVTNVSSYEVLDTYVHESNHAYQSYCIDNIQGYDGHTLSMIQAEFARDDNGNLYNYAKNGIEYDMQCSELDSNKAAVFMMAQKERYKNDAEYQAYISSRAKHFAEVNKALETQKDLRISMQNNQSYIAYIRGDIYENQYHMLNQNINNENYVDRSVEESKYVGDMLNELEKELGYNEEHAVSNDISYMGDVNLKDSDYEVNAIGNDYMGDIEIENTVSEAKDNGYMGDITYSGESSNNEAGTENDNTIDYE